MRNISADKQFFFEKKNQKTFAHLGHGRFHQPGLDYQKFLRAGVPMTERRSRAV
jgi:hypothetical protein